MGLQHGDWYQAWPDHDNHDLMKFVHLLHADFRRLAHVHLAVEWKGEQSRAKGGDGAYAQIGWPSTIWELPIITNAGVLYWRGDGELSSPWSIRTWNDDDKVFEDFNATLLWRVSPPLIASVYCAENPFRLEWVDLFSPA